MSNYLLPKQDQINPEDSLNPPKIIVDSYAEDDLLGDALCLLEKEILRLYQFLSFLSAAREQCLSRHMLLVDKILSFLHKRLLLSISDPSRPKVSMAPLQSLTSSKDLPSSLYSSDDCTLKETSLSLSCDMSVNWRARPVDGRLMLVSDPVGETLRQPYHPRGEAASLVPNTLEILAGIGSVAPVMGSTRRLPQRAGTRLAWEERQEILSKSLTAEMGHTELLKMHFAALETVKAKIKDETKSRLRALKLFLMQQRDDDPNLVKKIGLEIENSMSSLQDMAAIDSKSFTISDMNFKSPLTNGLTTRSLIPQQMIDPYLSPQRQEKHISPSCMSPTAEVPSPFSPGSQMSRLPPRHIHVMNPSSDQVADHYRSPPPTRRVGGTSAVVRAVSPVSANSPPKGTLNFSSPSVHKNHALGADLDARIRQILSQAPHVSRLPIPCVRVTCEIYVFDRALKLGVDGVFQDVIIMGPNPFRGMTLRIYICELVESIMRREQQIFTNYFNFPSHSINNSKGNYGNMTHSINNNNNNSLNHNVWTNFEKDISGTADLKISQTQSIFSSHNQIDVTDKYSSHQPPSPNPNMNLSPFKAAYNKLGSANNSSNIQNVHAPLSNVYYNPRGVERGLKVGSALSAALKHQESSKVAKNRNMK